MAIPLILKILFCSSKKKKKKDYILFKKDQSDYDILTFVRYL
jgi:hypothetical protein